MDSYETEDSAMMGGKAMYGKKVSQAKSDSGWNAVFTLVVSVVSAITFCIALAYWGNLLGGVTVNPGDVSKLGWIVVLTGCAFGFSLIGIYLAYRARRSVGRLG